MAIRLCFVFALCLLCVCLAIHLYRTNKPTQTLPCTKSRRTNSASSGRGYMSEHLYEVSSTNILGWGS